MLGSTPWSFSATPPANLVITIRSYAPLSLWHHVAQPCCTERMHVLFPCPDFAYFYFFFGCSRRETIVQPLQISSETRGELISTMYASLPFCSATKPCRPFLSNSLPTLSASQWVITSHTIPAASVSCPCQRNSAVMSVSFQQGTFCPHLALLSWPSSHPRTMGFLQYKLSMNAKSLFHALPYFSFSKLGLISLLW